MQSKAALDNSPNLTINYCLQVQGCQKSSDFGDKYKTTNIMTRYM